MKHDFDLMDPEWGIRAVTRAQEAGDVDQLVSLALNALFEMDRIRKALERIRGADRKRQQARRESAGVVTPAIRYAVLERDGFCCMSCGFSAADGVKLAVDHIVAVANGGKTEMSNLQTLCEGCNSGKSDR